MNDPISLAERRDRASNCRTATATVRRGHSVQIARDVVVGPGEDVTLPIDEIAELRERGVLIDPADPDRVSVRSAPAMRDDALRPPSYQPVSRKEAPPRGTVASWPKSE